MCNVKFTHFLTAFVIRKLQVNVDQILHVSVTFEQQRNVCLEQDI